MNIRKVIRGLLKGSLAMMLSAMVITLLVMLFATVVIVFSHTNVPTESLISTATIEPIESAVPTATATLTESPAPTSTVAPTESPVVLSSTAPAVDNQSENAQVDEVPSNGWEIIKVIADKNGHMTGLDHMQSLFTRRASALAVTETCTALRNVVRPTENAKSRLNGRYVRTKRPHVVEVDSTTGEIIDGYSSILVKLEIIDEASVVQLCGKNIDEITAQDIVEQTILVEEIEGRYLAGHKVAPGFRGPLVAKLHLENGRYLRVERWNFDTQRGDTSDTGTPTLVFVICSENGRTAE